MKDIEFIDLAAQQARLKPDINRAIARVLEHGQYIMGPEVGELEAQLCAFTGAKHCISCASGTDALIMALMAKGIGPGDLVFTPSFTFAATAEAIALLGATPVFVDVEPQSFNLDSAALSDAITVAQRENLGRPGAVIPVDLFGHPADHAAITEIAAAQGLWVLDDAAQGLGGAINDRAVGCFGEITATSFFPAKPLGCYGDGGALFTDDDGLAEQLRSIRVHGKGTHKYDNIRIGINGRLDTLQAAILIEKLAVFADELDRRDQIAARYSASLGHSVQTPMVSPGCRSAWAQYTLTLPVGADRAAFQARLKANGVPTAVYYPLPLHRQTAYQSFPAPGGLPVSVDLAARVVSLPMHPYLSADDQDRIIEAVQDALGVLN